VVPPGSLISQAGSALLLASRGSAKRVGRRSRHWAGPTKTTVRVIVKLHAPGGGYCDNERPSGPFHDFVCAHEIASSQSTTRARVRGVGIVDAANERQRPRIHLYRRSIRSAL